MARNSNINGKPDEGAEMASGASPMRRGRPPQGNAAEGRDKLLVAATALFSEQGLDSVSTRQLASAAGVNLSAITYHFGGKEQLYDATVLHAIDQLAPRREVVIAQLQSMTKQAKGDPLILARLIRSFMRGFFAILIEDELPVLPMRMLLRELHHPTSMFDTVIENHVNPAQDAIAGLAAVALGKDIDDPEVRLLGLSVASQVLMLGIMRPVVLSRMGWSSYSADNAAIVIKSTTTSILRLLGLPENEDETLAPEG